MSGANPFEFADLATAPLVVDAVYRGGTAGNAGDDPLARLLPVGNQGGFRFKGSPEKGTVKLAVLYTSGHNVDW
ncbi:MAG TPA: restriction endonuclease, partial [Planctomycetes bacterium]|nr:restriction endonuclease [Planctomycetota bacterium]